MTRIFDNIGDALGPHLQATLSKYDRIDAAVGYFNLRGWALFAPLIESKTVGTVPVARVLVGMTTADPGAQVLDALQSDLDGVAGDEDIDRDVARRRRERAILKFREQLSRGIPNEQDLETLRTLRAHLEDGRVAVKLFTRRPLHGKTYIAHRMDLNNPITAFVGSSNLTLSGLKHNYELNVDVLDSDGTKKLDHWFEDRWNDTFSLDITADLITLIDQSWVSETPLTPYDVYLKVCYHLSRDVREGLAEFSIPAGLREQLLDYQTSAVKTLARRIQHRGGTMLGDVVGLGKTITAVAVAATLREDYGYEPLIVCPKNLEKMWRAYLDKYELPGRVVPYSLAARDLPNMRRYRFVIVDESHTLRNSTRQDYQALHDYIRRNDSKVLLLTATPYNIRFGDVANQIGLYVDDDDDLGLQPLAAIAKNPSLMDKVDGKVTSLGAFRRSDEPDDWKRLMSDHLVRRTRGFVKANYSLIDEHGREYLTFADGSRFYFPTRKPKPIEHDFGKKDPARLMASDKTLDTISVLLLPRYGLGDYVSPDAKPTAGEQKVIEKIQRASGHLSGFVRTGLYKRLSSCGHSYTLSLQRHLARNELWVYAIDNDLPLPVGTILDSMFDSDPDSTTEADEDYDLDDADYSAVAIRDYDALKKRNPPSIVWVKSSLFAPDLRDHLVQDANAIRGLLSKYGTWDQKRDSKIDALADLLTGKHKRDKVLIFTEYADTARYVGEALAKRGIKSVGVVTGASSDPTDMARRFSPKSNEDLGQGEIPVGNEIRVLVTTDVLSEGQNLQDAHVVVNYDLPWAIIRLIQRAGRVDRIGQQSDTVFVYSFFHGDVEGVLNLRERIRHRLETNAQVFGSDERFFGTKNETATIEGLYNGDLKDDEFEAESDNDATSIAYEIWTNAAEEDPQRAERIKNLPDLVYATRPVRAEEPSGIGVYVRTDRGVDGFGCAETADGVRLMTGQEALRFFQAELETPSLPRQDNHFRLVADLVKGPLRRPDLVEGRLRGVRSRVWRRLNGHLATADPYVSEALDALYRRPLTVEADDRIRRALSMRDEDELAQLLVVLHADARLVLPDGPGSDPIRIVCTMGAARA